MKKYLQNYVIMFFFLFVIPSAFAMETKNRVQDNKKLGIAVAAVFAIAHLPKEKLTTLPKEMNDILLLKQDMEKAEKWFDTFNKSVKSTQTTNKKEFFLDNLLENGPMCIDSFSPVNFQQKNQPSIQKFNGSTFKKNYKPYLQKSIELSNNPQPLVNFTDFPATPIDVRYIREEAWSEKIKTQNCLLM